MASSFVIASVMYRNEAAVTNLPHQLERLAETIDSLFRGEIDNELPKRLSARLGEHVPSGVTDSSGSEGNYTLLRAEPSMLRVSDDCPLARVAGRNG